MTSKEFFFIQSLRQIKANGSIRVLEVGCGTAAYLPAILTQYLNIEYVGIEPIASSYREAIKNTSDLPNVKIYNELAYGEKEELKKESFDLVISFSVLEHVKQLDKFMDLCAAYVKPGGLMVHRYDLGHALYPSSLKERFHVWLGNNFPKVLPERKFVRYVPLKEVEAMYDERGFGVSKRTHHQLPSVKKLEKSLAKNDIITNPVEKIYEWELVNANVFDTLPEEERELLFPTVAIWGKKII